jgi:hypothetical protein
MAGQLAALIRSKHPGAYDDMDDATLETSVLAKYPEYKDLAGPDFSNVKGGGSSTQPTEPSWGDLINAGLQDNPALPAPVRGTQGALRLAKKHPVAAGAMAGGALAAPFTGGTSLLPAMAAAGLGSAGGAGAVIAGRQLVTGRPESAGSTAGTMALEGAGGAIGQGVGTGVVKLAGAVARPVAKAVMRLSPRLQQEYDDLIGTFLKERIPVGQSAEAGKRMSASAGEARNMAASAEAGGAAPVTGRDIHREFVPALKDVQARVANARPGAEAELQEILARSKAIKAQGPQSVTRNQELKQAAQSDASNAFRAQDRGATINDVTAKLDKAVAVGRQKAAETRVTGIKEVNKQTQNLMGLQEALEAAERKSASPLGWNPVNWGGAMFPGATSRVAFLADGASNALKRTPVAGTLRNALLAALGGSDE